MLILLVVSIFPDPATAQSQSLTMSVSPAYQGNFKYGEWLPVWVSLENNGADLSGEVQVSVVRDYDQVTYAVAVALPSGARKRLPVYVLPNNYTHELKVDLVVNDGVVQSQNTVLQPQPNINYLIGVAAQERGALALLPSIQLPNSRLPVVVDITLDTLPDRAEALNTLDCLILNDVDSSSLSPKQVDALQGWIAQGGRLLIGGGAGALQTSSGLPTSLLPLQPNSLDELDNVDSLAAFADANPIRVPGPFVVATGKQIQGLTLAEQDQIPLIVEVSLGEGAITFVALDLSFTPFDAWGGTSAFWEKVLSSGAAYPDWMPPDMSMRQLTAGPLGNALSNIPSLDLPSASAIVVLLAIYVLLVGPVNYLFLRWRKKLQWAWITIPVITLAFSGMSFGLGYAKRGTDLIINKIAIIQPQNDGVAHVSSYLGLFSPANQAYQIEVSGDNLLSPMTNYYDPWSSSVSSAGNLTFVQGDPSLVRGLTVNQWSMQSFMTETTLKGVGQVSADLRLVDGQLAGTITNESGYPLDDIVIVFRPSYQRLGDLAIGESIEVQMPLTSPGNDIYGGSMSWKIYEEEFSKYTMGPPPRELEFKRMVLEGVLDQQYYYGSRFDPNQQRSAIELSTEMPAVTLIGWVDAAPPAVLVNGQVPQEATTGLYISQIAFQIPDTGKISLPAGLIPGVIAQMPISGGTCGAEATSIWIDQGEAVLEFILFPQVMDIDIESLKLSLRTDGGWANSLDLAIYNWDTEKWQALNNAFIGDNTISDPGENISPEGLVRIKFSVSNPDQRGGGCYYFGLGLDGSH